MPQNTDEDRRRMPTEWREIQDISPEDIRVAVIGTVVDIEGRVLMVDDGTGKLDIEFESPEETEEFASGDKVRVVGRNRVESFEGEAVQDFSGFDPDLYSEVKEKLERFRN